MTTTNDRKDLDEQTYYHRTCLNCGRNWWGLHCPHDGYQNPCPDCGERPTQVMLNPIKSDTCDCEFVMPVADLNQWAKEMMLDLIGKTNSFEGNTGKVWIDPEHLRQAVEGRFSNG